MNTKTETGVHGPGRTVGVAVLLGLFACESPANDPSLVVRRDSAGVEILEALRPVWGDADGWRIDPEPIVDLAMSGSGPSHEFAEVLGMARLSDGSIAVADGMLNELVGVRTSAGWFKRRPLCGASTLRGIAWTASGVRTAIRTTSGSPAGAGS